MNFQQENLNNHPTELITQALINDEIDIVAAELK